MRPFTPSGLVVPLHALPSRQWFVDLLDALGRQYRFVSLAELERHVRERTRAASCCHLTFDDGHGTFPADAYPVLVERGIPASLFVSPRTLGEGKNYWFQDLGFYRDHLGEAAVRARLAAHLGVAAGELDGISVMSVFLSLRRDDIGRVLDTLAAACPSSPPPQNMSLAELAHVAASGLVAVGAHTLEHPVLANETDSRAEREIAGSVAELAEVLGAPVTAFAYPNGTPGLDFGPREQAALRRAGVTLAFSTRRGLIGRGVDPLAVPRGGCPDLAGEPPLVTLARARLLPWWDGMRRPFRRGMSENAERLALRARGLPGLASDQDPATPEK